MRTALTLGLVLFSLLVTVPTGAAAPATSHVVEPLSAPGSTVKANAPPVSSTQTNNSYANWAQFTSALPYTESAYQPPPAYGMASAYDAQDGYIVAFGGCSNNYGNCPNGYGSYSPQTWLFFQGRWTSFFNNSAYAKACGSYVYPDPRAFAAMAYDPEALPPPPGVRPVFDSNGSLVNGVGAVVMYGGIWGLSILGGHDGFQNGNYVPVDDAVWFFHAGCWYPDTATPFEGGNLPPPSIPPITCSPGSPPVCDQQPPSPDWLYGASMTYDAADNELVLVGGDQGGGVTNTSDYATPSCTQCLNKVWGWFGPKTWSTDTWFPLPSGPDARAFSSITYDARQKEVLLYGGVGMVPVPPLSSTAEVTPGCPTGHCSISTVTQNAPFTVWNNYTGGSGASECPHSPNSCYGLRLTGLPSLPDATLGSSPSLITATAAIGTRYVCSVLTAIVDSTVAQSTGYLTRDVSFIATSSGGSGAVSFQWTFNAVLGSGSGTSSGNELDISYSTLHYPFVVTLNVQDGCGDSVTIPIDAVNDGSFPVSLTKSTSASVFSVEGVADPAIGAAPLATGFKALVSGGTTPYTYAWNFGDGGASSNAQNPSHTYNAAGVYKATLKVTDNNGVSVSLDAPIIINVTATNVCYSSRLTGGVAPLGPSWVYNYFGSGTAQTSSNQQNPCATLSTTTYGPTTQLFQVIDSNGNVFSATVTTVVTDSPARGTLGLVSNAGSSYYAGLPISFTLDATGPLSGGQVYWDFGDTSVISAGPNQFTETHVYDGPGDYIVTAADSTSPSQWSVATMHVHIFPGNLLGRQSLCSAYEGVLIPFTPTFQCISYVPGTFTFHVAVVDLYTAVTFSNDITVTVTPPATQCSGAGYCSGVTIDSYSANPGACLYGCSATSVTFTVSAHYRVAYPAGCTGIACTIIPIGQMQVRWNSLDGEKSQAPLPGCPLNDAGINNYTSGPGPTSTTDQLTCTLPVTEATYPVTVTVSNGRYSTSQTLYFQYTPSSSGDAIVHEASSAPVASSIPTVKPFLPGTCGSGTIPGALCENSDLWSFKGGVWTQLHPARDPLRGTPPPAVGAAFDYDPITGMVVMYGGYTPYATSFSQPPFPIIWVYNGGNNSWAAIANTAPGVASCLPGSVNQICQTPPDLRGYSANVFDPLDGYILLFGGAVNSCTTQCSWPTDLNLQTQYGDSWGYNATTGLWLPNVGARIAGVDRYVPCPIENAQTPSMSLTLFSTNDTIVFNEHDICSAHVNVGFLLWDYANNSIGVVNRGQFLSLLVNSSADFALNYEDDIGQARVLSTITGVPFDLYQTTWAISPILPFHNQLGLPSTSAFNTSGAVVTSLAVGHWSKVENYTVLVVSGNRSIGSSYNASTYAWAFNVTDPGTVFNWWSQGQFLFWAPAASPPGVGTPTGPCSGWGFLTCPADDIWVDMALGFVPAAVAVALIEFYGGPGRRKK